jgi:hypothetical protein
MHTYTRTISVGDHEDENDRRINITTYRCEATFPPDAVRYIDMIVLEFTIETVHKTAVVYTYRSIGSTEISREQFRDALVEFGGSFLAW